MIRHIISTPTERAGKRGTPLLSHDFAQNLKGYAREAGIDRIHLHQLRHSFARIVAEESGSIMETRGSVDAPSRFYNASLRAADSYLKRQARPEDQPEIEESESKVMRRPLRGQ